MSKLIIEVVKKEGCFKHESEIIKYTEEFLNGLDIYPGQVISNFKKNGNISKYIESIIIEEVECCSKIELKQFKIEWEVYELNNIKPAKDTFAINDDDDLTFSVNWILPSTDLHGLWENLIFEREIKDNLLKFLSTMMTFAERGVDQNIISTNRLVLLHGPPGTGKTSLCKALAQKVFIRLGKKYSMGQLIEINSHSLFSKWFSESGKLVMKLFSKLNEFIEDPTMFVCVLIDEIESLAYNRSQSHSVSEPTDAIRVVNALLTEIDRIKKFPNVLILTTSNITQAIDCAFADRVDIKKYIGLPSPQAIYQIYYTCLRELMKTGLISPVIKIMSINDVRLSSKESFALCSYSEELMKISEMSIGLSGRTLRKIPLTAHALFAKSEVSTLENFLGYMKSAVQNDKKELYQLQNEKINK